MKLLATLAVALLIAGAIDSANACSRRNNGKKRDKTILFVPRNPPLMTPPTPNPTPPPPPPPLPTGWVPPPPRPPAQEMTRNNCHAKVVYAVVQTSDSLVSSAAPTRSQIQEQWQYTCTFQVYVEVDVAETSSEVNCACGITYQRQQEPDDPNYQRAGTSTEISNFEMVAYNRQTNKVDDYITAFNTLEPNDNSTKFLKNAAARSSMNYNIVAQGYAGLVETLDKSKFPAVLQTGNVAFAQHVVPAMCFTVVETFVTSYKWPQPAMPLMSAAPNVWISKCQPVYKADGTSYKRNTPTYKAEQFYFMKEFLLFPIEFGVSQSSSGFVPRPRYITSFYSNSNCEVANGVWSIAREFSQTFERENRFKLYGAFAWGRTYTAVWAYGGVPSEFDHPSNFHRSKFTSITWNQVFAKDGENYRKGVLYHALLGNTLVNGVEPYPGADENYQMCSALPDAWKDCDAQDGSGCADLRASTYAENAYAFRVCDNDNNPCDADTYNTFNCQPVIRICNKETTFLSFQNFGALARDFTKRRNSVLLTGPRGYFCNGDYPSIDAFDPVYYEPHKWSNGVSENAIKKRGVEQAQDVGAMLGSTMTTDEGMTVVNTTTPLDVPEASDVIIQAATGSADENGLPGGDHPIGLFPEQYVVPVTLNPYDTSYDNVETSIFDGSLAPCLEGSVGCTCRSNPTRPKCDAPLECNEQRNFCEVPTCLPGQAGCPCAAESSCSDSFLTCNADNKCVFDDSCEAGETGCPCKSSTSGDETTYSCTEANARCESDLVEGGICIFDDEIDVACTKGESGCMCADEDSCTSSSDVCDEVMNICVRPTCEIGAPGCQCDVDRCASGFECVNGACVQRSCPDGNPGCKCLQTSSPCSTPNFKCVSFKTDGSDDRCVAEGKNCGDQSERCLKYCGAGNVLHCPPCSNQIPVCDGAAALVPSVLVALVLAALALLF